jgi:hypothetical protein
MNLNTKKYLVASLAIILVLMLNIFYWHTLFLGLIFGLAFLVLNSYSLGSFIFQKDHLAIKLSLGLLFLLSVISSLGAIIYYFYKLDRFIIIILLIIITIANYFIIHKLQPSTFVEGSFSSSPLAKGARGMFTTIRLNKFIAWATKNWLMIILIIIYLLLIAYSFFLLFTRQTTEAIRSPWEILPIKFFISYFLATLVLISVIIKNKKTWLSFMLATLHGLLSFSVALIVYKVGYGFDPFIHQATEKLIYATGAVTPKTLYYLGQYSLVIFLTYLLNIDLALVDKILAPILAAIFIPLTIYYTFSRAFDWEKKNYLALIIGFLTLPFSSFIATTPQGLANLFSIIIILFGLLYLNKKISFYPLLILGFADFIIHPLAGVPIIIFLFFLWLYSYSGKETNPIIKFKKILITISAILACFILPIIFIIFSRLSSNLGISFNANLLAISQIISLFSPGQIQKKFHFVYDLIYSYKNYLNLFLLFAAFAGIFIAKIKKQAAIFWSYILVFLITLINYITLKLFISFSGLIEYEQGDYSERILELSFYFLIPLFLYAFYWLIKKIREDNSHLQFIWLCLISTIIAFSLYLSYPRVDIYDPGHNFSTSASDIKAVQYINKDSGNQDYIGLANQSVSVAAIREFGFKKYFQINYQGQTKEIFYYPIPTGDPLYQFYLDMVYKKPTKETMLLAMNLAGVNQAYFVINRYWQDSAKIIEEAMSTADSWQSIDNGKLFVFKYIK